VGHEISVSTVTPVWRDVHRSVRFVSVACSMAWPTLAGQGP